MGLCDFRTSVAFFSCTHNIDVWLTFYSCWTGQLVCSFSARSELTKCCQRQCCWRSVELYSSGTLVSINNVAVNYNECMLAAVSIQQLNCMYREILIQSFISYIVFSVEISGNIFFNPIPSHSQWFISIPNPRFSLVLFPFPAHRLCYSQSLPLPFPFC